MEYSTFFGLKLFQRMFPQVQIKSSRRFSQKQISDYLRFLNQRQSAGKKLFPPIFAETNQRLSAFLNLRANPY
jgi:hypothetical protein